MFAARPLSPWSWLVGPLLACLLATMLFAMPIRVLGLSLPEPVFPLVLAFSWAIIRPSILPPFLLLGAGLFLDLFWNTPMGLWVVALIAAYALTLGARAAMTGQGFAMSWLWFAVAAGVAQLVGLAVTLLDVGAWPNLVGVFWQWLATAALYPFAYRLVERYEDADVRFR